MISGATSSPHRQKIYLAQPLKSRSTGTAEGDSTGGLTTTDLSSDERHDQPRPPRLVDPVALSYVRRCFEGWAMFPYGMPAALSNLMPSLSACSSAYWAVSSSISGV